LTRFDLFSEIAHFDPFRNIDDIFRDFSTAPSLRGVEATPRIRMDAKESDQNYIVKARPVLGEAVSLSLLLVLAGSAVHHRQQAGFGQRIAP